MFEEDSDEESFEETVRSLVREVSQAIERVTQTDLDEVAAALDVDLARARELAGSAVGWLRAQAEGLGDVGTSRGGAQRNVPVHAAQLPHSGPHPLDLPTAEQGTALAAVDSGRWKVDPGSDALATDDESRGPADAPGLVDELRARDWITADCQLTLAGRHALGRWLDAAV